MQSAFAGTPSARKRRSVETPGGSETDVLPEGKSWTPTPLLLRHPPPEPGGAVLEHGHSVHPIWLPPSPKQNSLNSGPKVQPSVPVCISPAARLMLATGPAAILSHPAAGTRVVEPKLPTRIRYVRLAMSVMSSPASKGGLIGWTSSSEQASTVSGVAGQEDDPYTAMRLSNPASPRVEM